jgi:hypothetical protein
MFRYDSRLEFWDGSEWSRVFDITLSVRQWSGRGGGYALFVYERNCRRY